MSASPSWRRRAIGDHPDSMHIELAAEYILVTIRDLCLAEEGTYRFALTLDQQQPVVVDVPVSVTSSRRSVPWRSTGTTS